MYWTRPGPVPAHTHLGIRCRDREHPRRPPHPRRSALVAPEYRWRRIADSRRGRCESIRERFRSKGWRSAAEQTRQSRADPNRPATRGTRRGFGARPPWHQNPSVFLELLGNSDLLGIGGFAQQHFAIPLNGTARGWIRISRVGNRRFFSNDIQERPRQIFAGAEVCEDALDRGSESQGACAQEQDRVSSNRWVVHVSVRRAVFEELSARGQLHDQALQKA